MKKVYAIDPTSHIDQSGNPTNLGDIVIKDAISRLLYKANIEPIWVPFGTVPNGDLIIGGANVLAKLSFKNKYTWNLLDFLNYRHRVVLFGVGCLHYQNPSNILDRRVYRRVLNNKIVILSVRDSYTKNRLQEMGVNSVINTSCPTTYFIENIRNYKKDSVVFTVTDYYKDHLYDKLMIEILLENYSNVHFFPQGSEDESYINTMGISEHINIMEPNLDSFDYLFKDNNIDYVGTRLHGGIRAHQHGARAIILSVDNRAEEIKKDINLNVIRRGDLSSLEIAINNEVNSLNLKKTEMKFFINNLKTHFT